VNIEKLKGQFDAIFAARGQESLLTRTSLASGQIVETAYTGVGALAEIWRAYWPEGLVAKIDTSRRFRLLLAHVETIASVGGAGNEVFGTTHFPARVLDPAEEYEDGTYQRCYTKAAGTVCPVVAVADNADHRLAYVPYFDGEIRMIVESPRGGGELGAELFHHNLIGLHTENQELENGITFGGFLAPDYSFVVKVKSAYTLAWASGTDTGSVSLPFAMVRIPILVCPIHNFYVKGERYPGEALRAVADWCLAKR
jgi:hypothetical protein